MLADERRLGPNERTFTIGSDLWPGAERQLTVCLDVLTLFCGGVGVERLLKRLVELRLAIDLTIGVGLSLDLTVSLTIDIAVLAINLCSGLGLDCWSDNIDFAIDLASC